VHAKSNKSVEPRQTVRSDGRSSAEVKNRRGTTGMQVPVVYGQCGHPPLSSEDSLLPCDVPKKSPTPDRSRPLLRSPCGAGSGSTSKMMEFKLESGASDGKCGNGASPTSPEKERASEREARPPPPPDFSGEATAFSLLTHVAPHPMHPSRCSGTLRRPFAASDFASDGGGRRRGQKPPNGPQ
jgi:hypothetical protein